MRGDPFPGGAVSWPLLLPVLGSIGRRLPPGATVDAQHAAVHYQGHQRVIPYLVLAGRSLVSCTVFRVWRHRHRIRLRCGPSGGYLCPANLGTL